MIDLHTHSTASDGKLSPRDLIRLAKSQGLTAIALTDHDTTNGLAEASDEADIQGIKFIPGIELEIQFSPGEFHLLGLGLKDWSGDLQKLLKKQARGREDRNRMLYEKLKESGVPGTWEEVLEIAGPGQLGRPHFASWLVKHKRVKSIKEAFDTHLGPGCPFYLRKEALDLEEALEAIHQAGGRGFVAHPSTLYLSLNKIEVLFKEWKDQGLDGLEAWHSALPGRWSRRLEDMAQNLGLRVSAGSDFHGENRPDRRLGYTASDHPISEDFLHRALGPEDIC